MTRLQPGKSPERNVRTLYLAAVAFLFLSGCAATGPIFQPAPKPRSDQALLYIYRPASFYLGARVAHFEVDGRHVAELKNRGYTALYLTPGSHKVSHRWTKLPLDDGDLSKPYELTIALPPGSTRYVRLEARPIPD
jgi:hypothetical protein